MPDARNRLDDPDYAAFAWSRYRRIMRWMTLAAGGAVAVALVWLRQDGSIVSIHEVVAVVAGVGGSVLVASALMGLVFLSSGSGHDDDANRPEQP